MRNARIALALLALAVGIPLGLLVHRALQSVALERAERHRTVAERVFDEMERALSDVLRTEEARPFEGYADVGPAATFALGYVQVGPDGDTAVRGRGATALLEQAAKRAATEEPKARWDLPAFQQPGTTVGLVKQSRAAPAAPADKDEREASAYDALRSLNKAVSERVERQQKAKSAPPRANVAEERLRALGYDEGTPGRREAPAKMRDAAELGAAAGAKADDERALPPMTGRAIDAGHLLLSRTVVHGARAYRQGIVLDVGELGAFLFAQALGDATLASHATVAFSTIAPAAADPGGDFVYQHRFADPFDALSARLALRTLPGSGDARWVYALATSVVVAALLGLLALYRMVSVAVAYAERRSNFVAAVSHELKTPLTAIRMYGEMLRDGIVPSEAKRDEYYRHITAESERLSRLINNVLEFSRLEKGTRDVTLTTGPLEPVVREAVELVRPHVEAEGFTLRLATDGALPPVRFERDALLQVLFNLVDNAVKYARDGAERWVEVRTAATDGGVRLAVRDSGPGVPERHLPHVFEPFYRGERELTRRHKGTGIGLALVRGLVERMGARVGGRNVDGGGFEVTIAFPAAHG